MRRTYIGGIGVAHAMVNLQPTSTTTTDPWGQLGPQPPKFYAPKHGPWNFWKPHTSDYVAQAFCFQKNDPPIVFGSPTRLNTLLKAAFLFQKNDPHILGGPQRLTTLLKAVFLFLFSNMFPYFDDPRGQLWGWGSVVG